MKKSWPSTVDLVNMPFREFAALCQGKEAYDPELAPILCAAAVVRESNRHVEQTRVPEARLTEEWVRLADVFAIINEPQDLHWNTAQDWLCHKIKALVSPLLPNKAVQAGVKDQGNLGPDKQREPQNSSP